MDIMELTRKAIEVANQDEKLKEKIKDTVVTIVMLCKSATADDAERKTAETAEKEKEQAITISVDKGEIKFLNEGIENPDFQFEMSKENFTNLMIGKTPGLILMATKKMKMTKGKWANIGKIATPLGAIPKIGKEIAAKEG